MLYARTSSKCCLAIFFNGKIIAVQLLTRFILTTIPWDRSCYYFHHTDEETEAHGDEVTPFTDDISFGAIWVARKQYCPKKLFDLAELGRSAVLGSKLAVWNKSNIVACVGGHFQLGSQFLKSLGVAILTRFDYSAYSNLYSRWPFRAAFALESCHLKGQVKFSIFFLNSCARHCLDLPTLRFPRR